MFEETNDLYLFLDMMSPFEKFLSFLLLHKNTINKAHHVTRQNANIRYKSKGTFFNPFFNALSSSVLPYLC